MVPCSLMKRAGYSDGGGGGGVVLITLTQYERARQMWTILSLHHVEVFSFTLSMVAFLNALLSDMTNRSHRVDGSSLSVASCSPYILRRQFEFEKVPTNKEGQPRC